MIQPEHGMKETTTKEKVLKKIRDALVNAMPSPYVDVDMENPVIKQPDAEFIEESFAKAFSQTGGKFVFCKDVHEMAYGLKMLTEQKEVQQLFCREAFLVELLKELGIDYENDPANISQCDAAVTACEALVARHGSIVVSSGQECGRKSFVTPPLHIVVATNQQLVNDLAEAFRSIQIKYGKEIPSLITVVSGPSRTADIEKTIVHGAHGPKELYLFMLDIEGSNTDK